MSTALTVVQDASNAIQQGGLGVDFGSKLFALRPATLSIVQPSSTIENAVKGNLRINETGDQYTEMFVTLLVMPTEQRNYYIGNPSEMNRTLENLMCFSRDMITPDPKARIPQAVNCASCPRQDWTAWREYKESHNGQTNKALIPPCDASYYAVLLDTVYKLPLRMFIRSDARGTFEDGMQNLARTLAMGNAQGKRSNIFDVRFKLTTKLVTKGKFTYYVPVFTDFKYVSEEERQKFGEIYLQFVAQRTKISESPAPTTPAEHAAGSTGSAGSAESVEAVYENVPLPDEGEIIV